MKLFKTIDEKLRDLGFVKVGGDTVFGASYEKEISEYGYIQCLDIQLCRPYV